jgi:hypothetical protein
MVESANQASLLTYCSRPRDVNRDLFGKEIPIRVIKMPRNLPSVQVMRDAKSGHKRGT